MADKMSEVAKWPAERWPGPVLDAYYEHIGAQVLAGYEPSARRGLMQRLVEVLARRRKALAYERVFASMVDRPLVPVFWTVWTTGEVQAVEFRPLTDLDCYLVAFGPSPEIFSYYGT